MPPRPTTETPLPWAGLTLPLVVSTMGVYALIVLGATTAVLDGAAACPTWPTCHGQWVVGVEDPALLVAWGHRLVTVIVGVLLVWAAIRAHRDRVSRRVRLALLGSLSLFPVQMGIGAVAATAGAPTWLAATHLLVAMVIFSGLLLALMWQLESRVPMDDSTTSSLPGAQADDTTPPASVAADQAETTWGWRDRVQAYLTLTKPKLWWLLCLVAVAAMGLAAGPDIDPEVAGATVLGGVLAIAASGTFNNILERDVDRQMERTSDRPLVDGRLPVWKAVTFGISLTVASVLVFVVWVNVLAAALGLGAILFYSVIYTVVLKPNTDQNTVLGGAVGAFPALIGWAAVENHIGMPALVLGAVIFLWTPAHFYNLALVFREDYSRAGFPMLPVVRGTRVTRRHILGYLGATLVATGILGATTRLDWVFAITAVVVGSVFLWTVVRLYADRDKRAAWRAFHASNAYLGTVLVAILVDTLLV